MKSLLYKLKELFYIRKTKPQKGKYKKLYGTYKTGYSNQCRWKSG
jgi:hypothetical protein